MDELRKRIGQHLTQAREHAGLGVSRAAELLGIDRARLYGMEDGSRPVEVAMLSRAAQVYGVSLSYLIGDTEETAKVTPAMRLHSLLSQKATQDHAANLNGFIKFAERYQKLLAQFGSLLAQPDLPQWQERATSHTRKYILEGHADRLRELWGLGDAPIGLGIFDLLESRGIQVYREPLAGREISGAYLKAEYVGPMIFVNAADHPYRQVFSAAHELAHLLYDQGAGVSLKKDESSEEKNANIFASAFLVPKVAIDRHLDVWGVREGIEEKDVVHLHRTFGVSFLAMLVRLKQLGLISGEKFEEFSAQQPVQLALELGYPVQDWEFGYDPEHLPPKTRLRWIPRGFRALVHRALEVGEITDRMAARYHNLEYEDWAALQRQAQTLPKPLEEPHDAEAYVR